MIDITRLTDSDKNREVMYTAVGVREYGRITSWNDRWIWVRYHLKVDDNGKKTPRYGDTSEATSPMDLEFTLAKPAAASEERS